MSSRSVPSLIKELRQRLNDEGIAEIFSDEKEAMREILDSFERRATPLPLTRPVVTITLPQAMEFRPAMASNAVLYVDGFNKALQEVRDVLTAAGFVQGADGRWQR